MHARLLRWSLRARRARHLLNAAVLIITLAVLMVFVSVYGELVRVAHAPKETALTRGLIWPKLFESGLPMGLYDRLARTDGVVRAFSFISFNGHDDRGGVDWLMMGEQDDAPATMHDVFPTDPAILEAWKHEKPMGAMVSAPLAKQLHLSVGQEVEMPTSLGPLRVKVVGIHQNSAIANIVRVHYDYVKELGGNKGYCLFRMYTKPEDFARVSKAVEDETKNTASPVVVVSAEAWFANHAKNASAVPAVLGFLGLFLILTTVLTLLNTASISTRERRTETATMRVLGYHRRSIVAMLTWEALVLGALSGIVAIAITWFGFRHGVQLGLAGEELEPTRINATAMIAGAIAALVIPLLGALPSAVASVRAPLIEALRDSA